MIYSNILGRQEKYYHKDKGSCRVCNDTLVVGENWSDKAKDHCTYVCISCKNKENSGRMWVNGSYISVYHPLYKAGRYKSFNDAAFSSLVNYDRCKSGYVYVVSNPAWEGWYKIGKAVDAEDRCNQYQTSSPLRDYVLEHSRSFADRSTAEKVAHRKSIKKSLDNNGEWFKMNKEDVIKIIEGIVDETNT